MKKVADVLGIPIVAVFVLVGLIAGYISIGCRCGWNTAWERTE